MKRFKNLDSLTKVKVIYTVELLAIATVFLVIASLEISGVLKITDRHKYVFLWVTIFGGPILIGTLIWALVSPKKRAKVSLFDKFSILPGSIYVIVFDIIGFINYNAWDENYFRYGIPSALYYFALVYIVQAFYHWKHPLPELLKAIEEDKKNEEIKIAQKKDEDNKEQ